MQLPVTGHPLHTRSLTAVITAGEDGRLGVHAVVNDLRKAGFVPMAWGIQPAGIIHQMSLDLVLDPASRRIDSLEVDQPFVAIEPSAHSGGECCRDPAPRLQALVGEPVDAAFPRKLSGVFGGPRGCSHLLTLFQLVASLLPRALDREAALMESLGQARAAGERLFWRSCFVDGYEAREGEIELAIQLHDFHGRPEAGAADALDRLHRHDELRVFARVETPALRIAELHARERVRERPTLATAPWQDHDARVAPLVGAPVIPGLARRIFETLGDGSEGAGLRDALLQLAPGHIQVMAAVLDRWFARAGEPAAAPGGAGRDAASPIGGNLDSCWMWRREGPLAAARFGPPAAPTSEEDPASP